ncbi:DUF58 domain-containing protein [Luteimicrobium subarcticum]|uniref:Uncharacterized protein (DUF58 family) n=1 Tax=Luteimicrobium subarcticum TaxID=620910 RepID=A0A2M8WTX9_9MICO|nr:DUF58 domain-containing protein [Luteimicrobium subarcticum]PJI94348.1 uncharacterized protein (DUF58 family) [Luteimicrobium subarcticum]
MPGRTHETHVRVTPRGRALALGGGVVALLGFAVGLTDLVVLGLVLPVAVGVAAVHTGLHRRERRRNALTTTRRVAPDPVLAGQATDVALVVSTVEHESAARARLARMRISENVSAELAGTPPRGRQDVTTDEIRVLYSLRPELRGRWELGPATASVEDVFGLVEASRSFGGTTTVTVWPAVEELPARARSSFQHSSDAAAGSRRSSPDDAVLREYVVGDDLRRVHWASAARRGRIMVRADESAGTPPATVLFDRALLVAPPGRASLTRPPGEWAVSCAGSFAVALVGSGHATRVLGTAHVPDVAAVPHASGGRGEGRAHVLDQCVDLTALEEPAGAVRAVVDTSRALRGHRRHDELVLAVIAPQPQEGADALAGLAGDAFHGAVVVLPRNTTAALEERAADTVAALRSAGWRAVTVFDGSPVARAWSSLATEVA